MMVIAALLCAVSFPISRKKDEHGDTSAVRVREGRVDWGGQELELVVDKEYLSRKIKLSVFQITRKGSSVVAEGELKSITVFRRAPQETWWKLTNEEGTPGTKHSGVEHDCCFLVCGKPFDASATNASTNDCCQTLLEFDLQRFCNFFYIAEGPRMRRCFESLSYWFCVARQCISRCWKRGTLVQ